jgi:ParB family chromosome partitioning protein
MIRRTLGRGLDALIESAPPVGAGSGLTSIAIERISPSPFQPRTHFNEERLQELVRAIQSQGIIEPLVVRPLLSSAPGAESYELIAGERRLRAARAAGLEAVPVVIRTLDDRAALEMSLVENLSREDLGPIDEARAFARLCTEFGLGHEEIAGRIGKSRPHVSNMMRLLELPNAVLEMIERGALSAGQARPLLGLSSEEEQAAAALRIVEGGISARGAEQIARAGRRGQGKVLRHTSPDANVAALIEALQRALKRKVRIIARRGKTPGRLELEYYDDQDLSALVAALSGHQAPRAAAAL